jgi:NDP-sugar pyrophosphorylase family protein
MSSAPARSGEAAIGLVGDGETTDFGSLAPVDVTLGRAIVLAGGRGVRLRPYTSIFPKPLIPVGGRPVLDVVIRQLRHAGFNRVTLATGYLAELIEAYFGRGERHGLTIDYHREDEPLGTVGALALIEDLTSPFLVMNGDILTDLNYRALLLDHVTSGAAATIATAERHVQVPLGVVQFGMPGTPHQVTGWQEKPSLSYVASMGVYCFSPRALEVMTPGERLDVPELILRLVAAGETVHAWRSSDYWLDIGHHDDYAVAAEEFERVQSRLLPDPAAPATTLVA